MENENKTYVFPKEMPGMTGFLAGLASAQEMKCDLSEEDLAIYKESLQQTQQAIEIKEILGRELTASELTLLQAKGGDYLLDEYFQIPKSEREGLKHLHKIIVAYISQPKEDFDKEISYKSCKCLKDILSDICKKLESTNFTLEEEPRIVVDDNTLTQYSEFPKLTKFLVSHYKTTSDQNKYLKDPIPLNTVFNKNEEPTNLEELVEILPKNEKKFSDFFNDLTGAMFDIMADSVFNANPPAYMNTEQLEEQEKTFNSLKSKLDNQYKITIDNYKKRKEILKEYSSEDYLKKVQEYGLFERKEESTCSE